MEEVQRKQRSGIGAANARRPWSRTPRRRPRRRTVNKWIHAFFSMCKKICEVKPWSEALVNLWFVCNCTLFLFKPSQWQPQPWSPDVLKYLEVNLFPHIWDFSRDSHLCHVSCVMCVTLCPTGSSRHFWSTIFECFLDFYSESDSSSIPVTGQVRPGLCCSSWLYWAYGLWLMAH